MASLFVVRGRDQGRHFPLDPRVTRVGRDSSCEIRLLDSEASRTHAELRPAPDGGFVLIDLASSNGTLVNSKLITQHPLASGDRIEIGCTLLIFTGGGKSSAKTGHGVEIVVPPVTDHHAVHGDASRIVSSVSGAVSFAADKQGQVESDRNLELMYLTALAVGRTDSIPELLDRVLRLVFDWVAADRGCVMLRDGDSERLRPAARCDRDVDGNTGAQKGRIAISRTILDYVIERKEGVRTSDARDDARFDAAHSIVQGGIREALCVPLQGRYAVVGALYVDTYTSPGMIIQSGYQARFNDEHLRLMTAIGYQAALAIEDTYYYSAMVQSERLAAMGQTIATLSHHIKNILQGMRGGSYLIDAGLKRGDTDAVRRGWGIVERNQERISSLVMDMLTFSKEREPEKIESDLNETVLDVVDLMRSRAEEMDVQIEFCPDQTMPLAMFDPDAFHRALLNIVTNAIDAAAEGDREPEDSADQSEIESPLFMDESLVDPIVSDSSEDPSSGSNESFLRPARVIVATNYSPIDGWIVAVSDNGPGIAEEDREKIFSIFESKKGSRGTGLGLPVSDKIMREHGGRIEIADTPPPAIPVACSPTFGTCFILRFPPTDTGATLAE
ncbi:MAG TPA: peptide-binding protein [Planctomycetaceae bacterium]|nr:peptide-binding protein [Planctomycetaceae bacterium]